MFLRKSLLFLEDGVTALATGVPVAVVGHEEASSTPVTEWALPLNFTVNDFVVLAYCV